MVQNDGLQYGVCLAIAKCMMGYYLGMAHDGLLLGVHGATA